MFIIGNVIIYNKVKYEKKLGKTEDIQRSGPNLTKGTISSTSKKDLKEKFFKVLSKLEGTSLNVVMEKLSNPTF